jgi:hypothetical protein
MQAPELPVRLRVAFGNLRKFAVAHMTVHSVDAADARPGVEQLNAVFQDAHDCLTAYAQLAEEVRHVDGVCQ